MIQRQSHTIVYVLDQERARKFYVEKLGFEVCSDESGTDWIDMFSLLCFRGREQPRPFDNGRSEARPFAERTRRAVTK